MFVNTPTQSEVSKTPLPGRGVQSGSYSVIPVTLIGRVHGDNHRAHMTTLPHQTCIHNVHWSLLFCQGGATIVLASGALKSKPSLTPMTFGVNYRYLVYRRSTFVSEREALFNETVQNISYFVKQQDHTYFRGLLF